MAETKSTEKADIKAAEQGNAEVQAKADEALAKGYRGVVPDPLPNSDHSLASGPDSPPLMTDDRTRVDQPVAVTNKENPNA